VQSKGSMLAFTFVLLVMCLGAYAAFSTLTAGRGSDRLAQATATATGDIATPSPAASAAPTDTPSGEAVETPAEGPELSTPVAPSPTPVAPSTPTPLPTATSTPAPSPTRSESEPEPEPPGPTQYRVKRDERDCSTEGIIGGWVYDSDGNGLPWANLRLYNDYEIDVLKQSEGPPQAGKYEFTIFGAGLFHLVVVDEQGHPLGPVLHIDYQPDCKQRIDWERVG
jgi:hypothetical protein